MSTTCTKVLKSLTLGGLMLAATAATASASPPEMVLQMRNTAAADGCYSVMWKAGLMSFFRAQLVNSLAAGGEVNPNPQVLTVPCANGKEIIGVWFKAEGTYGVADTVTNRRAALAATNILSGSETFATRTTKTALWRKVNEEIEKKRRLDTSGKPDPNGPVHLNSFALDFWTGHVRTTVDAQMEVTGVWDYYFQIIQQDNLSLANGQVQCTSDDPEIESDSTWYDIATVISGNFLDVFVHGILNPEMFGWLERKISSSYGEGPGCAVAASIPQKIMLPGTHNDPIFGDYALKLVMSYSRLISSNDTGITAGGTYARQMRQPTVAIDLASESGNVIRSDNSQYTGKFRYWTEDLRPPFQSVQFAASGNASVASDGRITWTLPSQPGPGGSQQWARVTITDADGLRASALMVVYLKFSLTPDLPPICDQHPTHYECNN